MSLDSSNNLNVQSATSNRVSFDEGSINLNDDLTNGSDYSVSSFVSTPGQNPTPKFPHANSSFRTSIDETLSSSHYNIFNNQIEGETNSFSPLGPNSIYELTIASDQARLKRNRPARSYVTLNGGSTTVSNLRSPTTKEIPQIHLSKLVRKVNDEEIYTKLVKNTIEEYQSFESNYKPLTEDSLQKFAQQDKLSKNGKISASSSVSNFQELLISADVNDISQIPEVFLSSEFRLDDPRTFKQVIENSTILSSIHDETVDNSLINNTNIQEKLSDYLDIVEVNLIKEIAKSSESFFSTIGDIQTIKKQSNDSTAQFESIISQITQLENENSQIGIDILNGMIKHKNVELLESSLLQLSSILSVFELANTSFNGKEYSKCLNEIIVTENLIQGSRPSDEVSFEINLATEVHLTNLSGLPALVHLQHDLQNLKNECSKGYINNFIELLLEDLREHYRSVPTQDTLNRMYVAIDKSRKYSANPVNRSYLVIPNSKKESLSDFIENLVKSGHLTEAFATYQDKIIAEIKHIIKINLPSSSLLSNASVDSSNPSSRSGSVPPTAESTGSSPHTLSTNIKSLTPKEFETLISKTYTNLSECLRRLTAHQKILLDLALTALPPSLANTIDVMSLDITTSIHKAIELTQIRLTKIVNVRVSQTADLTLNYYLRFYSITSGYLQECELINPGYVGNGSGGSLSEWFKSHINFYVHRFHSNSMKNLMTDVDREVWKEVTAQEVLAESQTLSDEIVGYSKYIESGGTSGGFSGESWLEILDFYQESEPTLAVQKPTAESRTKLKMDDELFMIPNLTHKSLRQVRDYLILGKFFSGTSQTIEKNILNYFKLMNSKASQSVLNAGATRTAGLKHITTKHLALCIQLVEFNIALLGHLQNIFPSENPAANALSDEINFNRIISNYKDHENELFSKLVSIMYDRTAGHCTSILQINWSEPVVHPKACHQYMETVVKETLTVSKVLFKYLPPLKSALILSQIFDNYKKLFVECFCTQLPQFKDFNEKHCLLKDIDYFRVKLCDLAGYGNSGQVIWENVNSMPTVEDTQMEKVMKNNIDTERQRNAEIAEKASAEKASAEKASAEKASAEKASAEKASAEKASAEKASAEKASAEKVSAEKVSAEKISAEKISAEKVSAEKVSAEKESVEKIEKTVSENVEVGKENNDPETAVKTDDKTPSSSISALNPDVLNGSAPTTGVFENSAEVAQADVESSEVQEEKSDGKSEIQVSQNKENAIDVEDAIPTPKEVAQVIEPVSSKEQVDIQSLTASDSLANDLHSDTELDYETTDLDGVLEELEATEEKTILQHLEAEIAEELADAEKSDENNEDKDDSPILSSGESSRAATPQPSASEENTETVEKAE